MIIPVQYAYLTLGLAYLAFWIALFLYRPDVRREMFISSTIAGILALVLEPFFRADYWTPELFNGWTVGVEDFLYGFAIGGIASALYEEVFKKRFIRKKSHTYHWRFVFILYLASFVSLFVSRQLWGLNTMYATLGALAVAFFLIIFFRLDLVRDSIWTGILFTVITLFAYIPTLILFPDFVSSFWHLQNLSGAMLVGLPFEELLWAFMFGLVAGPFYEVWEGLRFRKA